LFGLVLLSGNADRTWKSKADKEPRRSARKKGKTCGRPFKEPRPVKETENEIITVTETENNDSQVEISTETANGRDIQARQEAEPHRIPFIRGIKMMSSREAEEMSAHGEVLRWSTDSDREDMTDTREERTIDSVESTPNICNVRF
jgi:hypothetical protein